MSDTRLLRIKEVSEKTGLCRSAIYATEGFPKSIKLGGQRAVAWVSDEIDAWIKRMIAESRRTGGDQQAA